MGFFSTMFSTMTNKWVVTSTYCEAQDCRGDGHRIRILNARRLEIYPNYQLLQFLRTEPEVIMQFSVNGSVLPNRYSIELKGDHVTTTEYDPFVVSDFEKILRKHGVIQIGLNGITAGMYNDKGYF